MSDKKPVNPLVVVLMIVGTVGALGFALWQFLGSGSAPVRTAEQPKKETQEVGQSRRTLPSDTVAVGTNPFKGSSATATGGPPMGGANPTAAARTTPPPGPLPAPLLISRDRAARAGALAGLAASERSSAGPSPLPLTATQPMPVAVEPELVGTMVGARPTAVFKSDKTMVMVPQGAAYRGWRVMAVGHGEATVWNGGVTLKLRVGSPSTGVTRTASSDQPQGYAEANLVVVHYTGRPAPTRQDLVYGRIEDPAQYGMTGETDEPTPEPLVDADATPPALNATRTEIEETPPIE
jgi:hypothetical protein